MVNMYNLARYCVKEGHKHRRDFGVDEEGKNLEICDDCLEGAIEGLKIDAGWYAPYGY